MSAEGRIPLEALLSRDRDRELWVARDRSGPVLLVRHLRRRAGQDDAWATDSLHPAFLRPLRWIEHPLEAMAVYEWAAGGAAVDLSASDEVGLDAALTWLSERGLPRPEARWLFRDAHGALRVAGLGMTDGQASGGDAGSAEPQASLGDGAGTWPLEQALAVCGSPVPLGLLAELTADRGEEALRRWTGAVDGRAWWEEGEVWLDLPSPTRAPPLPLQEAHARAVLQRGQRIWTFDVDVRSEGLSAALQPWAASLELVVERFAERQPAWALRARAWLALRLDVRTRAEQAQELVPPLLVPSGEPAVDGDALLAAARVLIAAGRHAESVDAVERAVPQVEGHGLSRTRARTWWAEHRLMSGQTADTLAPLEREREEQRAARRWGAYLFSAGVHQVLLEVLGEPVRAAQVLDQDLELARSLGWPAAEALLLNTRARSLGGADPLTCLRAGERAHRLALLAGEPRLAAACALHAGQAALALGDIDLAEEYFDHAYQNGSGTLTQSVSIRRLWIRVARWEVMEHGFAWMATALHQTVSPPQRFELMTERGGLYTVLGRLGEARASFAEASALSSELGWAELHPDLVIRHLEEAMRAEPGTTPAFVATLPQSERSLLAVARGVHHARQRRAPETVLWLGPELAWVRVGQLPDIALLSKSPARRIVLALVELHEREPARAYRKDELIALGWPNEKILPEAALNRLHVLLAKLRAKGLRDVIETRGEGYALRSDVQIRR